MARGMSNYFTHTHATLGLGAWYVRRASFRV
jgi:hypothetical protein